VLAIAGAPVLCLAATVGLSESLARPAEVRIVSAISPVTTPAPTLHAPPVAVAQVQGPRPTQAPAPPAPTAAVVPGADEAISLGLIIDNSGSMRDHRAKATAAAIALVNSSHPRDEMFIVNFDDASFLDQPLTDDKQKLEAAIRKSAARGGSAMRGAISSAVDYSQSGKNTAKALVVISDGDDNTSHLTMQELVQKAHDSGVAIYTIGLLGDNEPDKSRKAKRALRALAEGTGGMDFYPKDQAEMDQILVQLEREIRDRTRTMK
jgi:VWFA-related protein